MDIFLIFCTHARGVIIETKPSVTPSTSPSTEPSMSSDMPSRVPSSGPSEWPSMTSDEPSAAHTLSSEKPSMLPSGSSVASTEPSIEPAPEGCDTCLMGRVGHWNFNVLSSGYTSSPDGTTIIERGTSAALAGVDAMITGNGSTNPLVADGKFGSALIIPAGTANYAVSFVF